MLAGYGAHAAWGLRVHSPCGLTPRYVLTHKEKREIHRTFISEPIQALNVQKTPYHFSFSNQNNPKA